jgi:hypothetical protein
MDDFDSLAREIRQLQSKDNLQSYEAQDLVDNVKTKNAIREVLKYYMTHDDYMEYMELQRIYGNVG